MKIADILTEDQISLDLKSANKENVIRELVKLLDKNNKLLDKDLYLQAVLDREKTFSTGIGMGVAIPHGKSSGVREASIAFGKHSEGIDFGSMDGKPAYLFFLIAAPETANDEHLRLLSQLSRKLMHQDIREGLMKAETPSEIINILNE